MYVSLADIERALAEFGVKTSWAGFLKSMLSPDSDPGQWETDSCADPHSS
jgi:hypothetical protein